MHVPDPVNLSRRPGALPAAIARLVELCRAHAAWVVLAAAVLTVALGVYTARNLGMTTDAFKLIDPTLEWRQREIAFRAAFPRDADQLVVVVDGRDPVAVDEAAESLAARLAADARHFNTVSRANGGAFFERNGLLFLPLDELMEVADRVVAAQPLIGSLAADPTLRGLFAALNLALDGVARGETDMATLERPLAAIADTVDSVLAEAPRKLNWRELITGRAPESAGLRQIIVAQPRLDFTALSPGAESAQAVRAIARELGLVPEGGARVRLTGSVALSDEEFASIADGAVLATLLSFGSVASLLYLALRSVRLVLANLVTLVAGLVATAAFAAVAVGSLNLISVAFGVMFIGLAVDFGIQFCVRYREERFRSGDLRAALGKTASGIAGPLVLAAVATAIGFWSFIPTAYVGVSELGLIAGVAMIIAVLLNLTLLPALIALLRPPDEPAPVGYAWAAGIEGFLLRRRWAVQAAALGLALLGAALLPGLRFDANPLNLRDPGTESVSTLVDLMADPLVAGPSVNVVTESPEAAAALAPQLAALPEVARALSINSFVPGDQTAKLAIVDDLALLVGPALSPLEVAPPPDPAAIRAEIAKTVARLQGLPVPGPSAARLADALRRVLDRGDALLAPLRAALLAGLDRQLELLRRALEAERITLEALPADLRESWLTRDGRARVEAFPVGDPRDSEAIRRFVLAVRGVAPDATGGAVSHYEGGRVVVRAFATAAVLALAAITLLLAVVLRRPRDVLFALLPLVLAGVLTLATCAVIDLPINFANIIALPLLLGIGVAFSIYFVMNWRAGMSAPLRSPTARAVIFSALTTAAAFGSLAASKHPGTASMGLLLAIALGYMLACALLVLPALLGPVWRPSSRQPSVGDAPAAVTPSRPDR